MKSQTAFVLVVIAALLIVGGIYSRSQGGGLVGRWFAAMHGR